MSISNESQVALVKEQVANMLVEPLQAASVLLDGGVTIFDSSEPLKIPKLTGDTNPSWVGANELIPETSDVDFTELSLMPTELKSIKTITRVSNELIRQARVGVSAVLEKKIVDDVRTKLDAALIDGDGVGNTITGVMNQPGLTSAPFDPTDPDTILDALATLAAEEVTATGLYIAGADFFAMRKLKDSTGRYLLEPNPANAAQYQLQGVPVKPTNKLLPGNAFIGNIADIAVVRDNDPTVVIDQSRYLDYDQTAIRVTCRYDVGVIRDESILLLDGDA